MAATLCPPLRSRVSLRPVAACWLLAALAGCGGEQAPTVEEYWHALYMGGQRAGYQHTRIETKHENGQQLMHVRQVIRQELLRFGQPFENKLEFDAFEQPDGQLVRFDLRGSMGEKTLAVSGHVADGDLIYHGTSERKPWETDVGGFFAVEQSLERQPMEPGEKRSIRRAEVDPVEFRLVVADCRLAAADYESVPLRDGSAELLRIDVKVSIAGQEGSPQVLWTDRQGRVIKAQHPAARLEMVKCSKTEATRKIDGPRFDVGVALAVPVEKMPAGLKTAGRARYRVRLREGDPSSVFTSGPSQRVRRLDERTAEIVVQALRPDTPGVVDESRPGQGDLLPGRLLQSDHEKVVALAQAAADEKDRWKLAKALEWHLKKSMKQTTFTKALVTAADVAEALEGDCTEYAMLLAAMARARGIPSRVALGLVESGKTFGFHMWTEVYIADRWLGLDATRAQGGISAAYLKLTDTNLAGQDDALQSLMRLAAVIGQFEKIEVLEAE